MNTDGQISNSANNLSKFYASTNKILQSNHSERARSQDSSHIKQSQNQDALDQLSPISEANHHLAASSSQTGVMRGSNNYNYLASVDLNTYEQPCDQEIINRIFTEFDTLNYDSLNTDTCMSQPMPWGVDRKFQLYISPDPTSSLTEPYQAPAAIKQFYLEAIHRKIAHIFDLRHPTEISNIMDFNEYYPLKANETLDFNGLAVTHIKTVHLFDFLQSIELLIKSPNTMGNDQDYSLEILHVLNWPDFDAIPAHQLIQLGNLLLNKSDHNNVLVHCLGGSGRTGTLVTFAQLKLRFLLGDSTIAIPENNKRSYIQAQIEHNREIKGGAFIETPDQLKTIFSALYHETLLTNSPSMSRMK